MQATGLFQIALCFAGGLQFIELNSLRRVKAEGVKVRAPDLLGLHYCVGSLGPEPQGQVLMPNSVVFRFIRHRPFMQTEAGEIPRPL
ncbi:hypothetical protein D3C74_463540 [compost metagenome]